MSDAVLLNHYSVLEFQGADAQRFCQAQLMNDVNALQDGQSQWTGWLTPKGRLVALGLLIQAAQDRFYLLLPDYPAEELQQRMSKFVLRSKLSINVKSQYKVVGSFDSMLEQTCMAQAELADGRRLYLIEKNGAVADAEFEQRWRLADFKLGIPRLELSQFEQWTPHMLSLDMLQAFSTKKGCYPGQEIVARTHFLGTSKRQLVAIQSSNLRVGQEIYPDAKRERANGMVISVDASGNYGQAVLFLPLGSEGYTSTEVVHWHG